MIKKVVVTKIFDASIEEVWQIWTDPELVKQWWGPDKFICDVAKIDFREGGISLVNMIAPKSFGGAEHFNIWAYTKIELHKSIEYIQNFADKNGVRKKPTAVGMPADFPEDVRTVVTFNAVSKDKTEMTVTEYADFAQMTHFAKLGLEQSLDKATSIFTARKY